MARAEIDLSNFSKRIKAVESILDTGEVKNIIGQEAVRYLRGQTRLGERQPPLMLSTIKKRAYLAKYNDLDKSYRGEWFSNLTLTGQFLKAMTFESIPGGVRLFIADVIRKPYRGKKGLYKSTPSNARIAEGLSKIGRSPFFIDNGLKKQIKSFVTRFIRRALKRT